MISRDFRLKTIITQKDYGLVLALVLISTLISSTTSVTPRRTTKLKNSPIYYISANLMKRGSSRSNRPQIRLPVRSTMPQKMSTLMTNPYAYSYSTFYKLPTQFVSNAKPIDIITGLTKTTTKKVVTNGYRIPASQASKMSNLIYLPITYLSNAKPIKVMINSFGKKT